MNILYGETYAKELLCVALIISVFLWPQPMKAADNISFSVDLASSFINSETRNISGETSMTDSRFLSQKYRLFFENEIYPLWKLRGGGLFERNYTTIDQDGLKSDNTSIRKNPFIDMVLGSTLLNASVGYNHREDRGKGTNQPEAKRFRDIYSSSLSYKPYDLPTLSLRFTRTNSYDGDRTATDTTQDRLLVSSRYRPVKTVELIYSGQQNTNSNHLRHVETINTIHSGRATYSDQFINKRLSVNSSYAVSHRNDELRAGQDGEVETPVTAGVDNYLYGLDQDFDPAEDIVGTDPNDLGLLKIRPQQQGLPGNTINIGSINKANPQTWNIGLEFNIATQQNLLRVFVTTPAPNEDQDLTNIAGSFSWDVYTSDGIENDGVNDVVKWTKLASGVVASYDAFTNSFDVRFATVTTRFLKVVVTSLGITDDPNSSFPNIYITSLTSRLIQPVADAKRKSWNLTQLFNMSAQARLLENPGLNYNFTLFYTESKPTTSSRFSMSNSMSLQHKFADWLYGHARAGRDDTRNHPSDLKQIIYRYSAGLNATPLPTLSHNLTYSGQHETTDGETTVRNSVSLYNRAALYRGIDLLLGSSYSTSSQPQQKETENTSLNYGLAIKPHQLLHMNLIGSRTRSTTSQLGEPDRVNTRKNNRFSLSYTPLETLSLFLALEEDIKDDKRRTLQSYSASWSPLSGGALQCNLSYSENVRPEEDVLNKLWTASLRWQIRPATYATLSYSSTESHSSVQDSTVEALNISLKARF